MNTKTYFVNVNDDNESKLINKLNKFKAKYSAVNGFNISWEVNNITLTTPSKFSKIFPSNKKIGIITTTKQYVITVENPYIKYDGYDYIGTVEKNSTGTFIVNNIGGMNQYDAKILEIANEDIRCDHCHTNRKRNKAYVFVNTNTDELLMIASTCSEAYFGMSFDLTLKTSDTIHKDIKKIDVMESKEVIFDSFLYSACVYNYLINGKYNTSHDPFPIVNLFNYMNGNTRIETLSQYEIDNFTKKELQVKSNVVLGEFDYEDMMDYYTKLEPKTPFEHNIKMAMFASTVNSRASYKMRAIGVDKYIKFKTHAVTPNNSCFIGNKDEKITVVGKVTNIYKKDGFDYNGRPIITNFVVINSNNNIIITSDYNMKFNNTLNKTVTFDCKVKSHKTYKDTKQTEVFYVRKVDVNEC